MVGVVGFGIKLQLGVEFERAWHVARWIWRHGSFIGKLEHLSGRCSV
jgi:hypothetical protein